MRILLIHQYFLEANQGGGSRFNEFTRYWREAGNEVTVVAGSVHYATGERSTGQRGIVRDETTADGVKVRRCHVSATYNRSFLGRLWAYFSFMLSGTWAALTAGPHDIVVATSPPLFAGVPGLIAAKVRRRPFIFEVRDLWPESAVDTGVLTNPLLIRLSFWLEALLYRQASAINALTPAFQRRLIENKGVPADKVWLIPNGADLDLLTPGPKDNTVRRKLGLEDKYVVSYIGAHGVANHLMQMVETAEFLRDHTDIAFLLIGDGMEKPMLQEEVARRKLTNIHFVATQPKSAIGDYINASDVCCAVLKDVATFRTVYPNKVFDYMSCARPTIVAIDGVARGLVEDAQAGLFVPPEDHQGLARAVLDLKAQPALAAEMGQNGRRFVEENFDRAQLARAYARLLHGIQR